MTFAAALARLGVATSAIGIFLLAILILLEADEFDVALITIAAGSAMMIAGSASRPPGEAE